MLRKIIIAVPIIVLLIGCYYLSFHLNRIPNELPIKQSDKDSTSTRNNGRRVLHGVRTNLHPLASVENLNKAKQQRVTTWQEWLEVTREVLLAELILYGEVKTPNFTASWVDDSPEWVEEMRTWFHETLQEQIKVHQRWLKPPPNYPGGLQHSSKLGDYKGLYPPTSTSLMMEFDAVYKNRNPNLAYLEEQFPKEAWLNTLIEKGADIKSYNDYRFYLGVRQQLLEQKDNPEEWTSGLHGIPITTDFDEYADSYIDRKIWEYDIVQRIRTENEGKSPTVYFDAHDPSKYFPVVGNMTYVNLGENRDRMSTFGVMLTLEQRRNLMEKGIEPKDIEIIYLDDDNNVLPNAPPILDKRQRELEKIVSYDGIKVTPENYEQLMGLPPPEKWLEWYENQEDLETQNNKLLPSSEYTHVEVIKDTVEAAKAEFEKFQNSMRQLEQFATMSDAEIEKTLERQFRRQFLSEHPLEQLEQITPARLERALGTLFQHGYEEGIKRIRLDNEALANQLERYFGQGQKTAPDLQKKRQTPILPKPPETTSTE